MICEMCKPLLSEYADDRLDAAQRGRVETHLARCPECAALAHDFSTLGGLLRGLPVSQTSSQFEARLAERLTQTIPARHSWPGWLTERLRPAPSVWRPALAFGAAAATIAGAILLQHPTPPVQPPPVSEGSLVTHCVQQHRSYVGAQPLADLAAQNLANQLDETAAAPAAAPSEENDL